MDYHQDLAKKQADVDPTISLAFTLDAHPGSYALLPGAGRPISSAPRIGSQKALGPISAYDDSQVPQTPHHSASKSRGWAGMACAGLLSACHRWSGFP